MPAETFSPDTLPSSSDLAAALSLEVLASDSSKHSLASLLLPSPKKTLVIFIRHFHCGVCQDYIKEVGKVRTEALDKAGVGVVVVGCGEASVIPEYIEVTDLKHPIYADPKKALYVALGMTRRTLHGTPSGGQKREYIKQSYLSYAVQGALKGPLSHPISYINSGDIAQLGGEFIFEQSEAGPVCTFAWRMRNTEDHTDVKELMKAAGVEYP